MRLTALLLAAVLCSGTAVAADPPDGEASFVRSPAGEALHMPGDAPRENALRQVRGLGNDPCSDWIAGFQNPGAVVRDGDLLYVGNNENQAANLVIVVDVSRPGLEVIVDQISAPVNPVDLAVVGETLYVIDQNRNALHYRSVLGGPWQVVPLPNGTVTEWDYGNIIFPYQGKMYVVHVWENLIDVVDLATHTVQTVISDLDHLPDRIDFSGQYMVVLAVGLDAPSCGANGPNFSVFELNAYHKLYRKDISGNCAKAVTATADRVYITFNDEIRSYDLLTGNLVDVLGVLSIGHHVLTDGQRLLSQTYHGDVLLIDLELAAASPVCNVLQNDQIWMPPIEEMVLTPPTDGRVFITNRNDDTLSILELAPPCSADVDGDAVIDSADVALLLGSWGPCPGCPADIDGNGVVGASDLAQLLGSWGPCAL